MNPLKPFRARCRRCGYFAFLPKVQSWFYCMNCGHLNKPVLGIHNPRNICGQCGYYFGYEPADYCTNPTHRAAYDQAKAEDEAREKA